MKSLTDLSIALPRRGRWSPSPRFDLLITAAAEARGVARVAGRHR